MTPEIEALLTRLEDDPDDLGAYLVLADALQVAGDPRGELIQLSHELGKAPGAALQQRTMIAKDRDAILGKLWSTNVNLAYRLGFPEAATVRGPDAGEILAAILRAPQARLLRSVAIRVEARDGAALATLGRLAGLAKPRALRRVLVGIDRQPDPGDDLTAARGAHLTHRRRSRVDPEVRPLLDDLSSILAVFPEIAELVVDLGLASLVWAPLCSPRLRRFTWVTPYAARREVAPIAASELPALEAFAIWLGARHTGTRNQAPFPPVDTAIEAEELVPVLAMLDRCRALRELGLCNVGHAFGAIAAELIASPLVQRLEVLDLTACDLFEHGADVVGLVRAAPRLVRLRLEQTSIPDDVVRELAARVTVEGTHLGYRPALRSRYRQIHEPW